MQNDNLKDDIKKINDDLKSDGDKLVKDFEKTMEEHGQQLVAEILKHSSKNTE